MKLDPIWRRLAVIAPVYATLVFAAGYLALRALAPDPSPQPAAAPHGQAPRAEKAMAAPGEAPTAEATPQDGAGWAARARSYAAAGRFAEAAAAFRQAVDLLPGDADLLVDYADALAAGNNGDLRGEPERLLRRALVIDPGHVKGLALAGTEAFKRGEHRLALRYWKQALASAPADSGFVPMLQGSIADAESRLQARPASHPPVAAAGRAVIGGRVSLDAALQDQVGADDTVFVAVRAADTGKMPLAALRTRVRELPIDFAFDDEAAMSPGHRLSDHARLVVVARVSRGGDATVRPGDYEGVSEDVAPGRRDIRIVIDRVRP